MILMWSVPVLHQVWCVKVDSVCFWCNTIEVMHQLKGGTKRQPKSASEYGIFISWQNLPDTTSLSAFATLLWYLYQDLCVVAAAAFTRKSMFLIVLFVNMIVDCVFTGIMTFYPSQVCISVLLFKKKKRRKVWFGRPTLRFGWIKSSFSYSELGICCGNEEYRGNNMFRRKNRQACFFFYENEDDGSVNANWRFKTHIHYEF